MRRTPNLKMLSLLWLLSLALGKVQAQQGRNYAIYANIIYRFTKYINRPVDRKTGDFVIGIVGDTPLYEELKKFTATRTVGNQKIVVKRISSAAAYGDCQILFVCEDESGSLKKIAALTAGAPVLLLSESEGLEHNRSCINFIIIDEHLKLEINKNNIGQRNLGIASELLSLGIIVQ
jgi:YfiR/HmsC-like